MQDKVDGMSKIPDMKTTYVGHWYIIIPYYYPFTIWKKRGAYLFLQDDGFNLLFSLFLGYLILNKKQRSKKIKYGENNCRRPYII